MFDMNTLAVAETGFLHLKGPKNALLYLGEKKVGITLWSPGSAEFAQAEADNENEVLALARENGGRADETPAQKAEREARLFAKITKSFDNWTYTPKGGAKLTGAELFRAAYADRSIGFILQQVKTKHGDWGLFTNGSAES